MDNQGRMSQAEYHSALDNRDAREKALRERISELEAGAVPPGWPRGLRPYTALCCPACGSYFNYADFITAGLADGEQDAG